jgi:hypothetical protein
MACRICANTLRDCRLLVFIFWIRTSEVVIEVDNYLCNNLKRAGMKLKRMWRDVFVRDLP